VWDVVLRAMDRGGRKGRGEVRRGEPSGILCKGFETKPHARHDAAGLDLTFGTQRKKLA
jgi:hypothetical protein